MKKIVSPITADVVRWLFTTPGSVVEEKQVPRKSTKSKTIKMAWYAGEIKLSDKQVDKLEEKGILKGVGDGKYGLDEEGIAVGQMITTQKVLDFDTGLMVQVKNYHDDPLVKPQLFGIAPKEAEDDPPPRGSGFAGELIPFLPLPGGPYPEGTVYYPELTDDAPPPAPEKARAARRASSFKHGVEVLSTEFSHDGRDAKFIRVRAVKKKAQPVKKEDLAAATPEGAEEVYVAGQEKADED